MNGGGTVIRTLRKIQTLSPVLSFRTRPRLGPRRRERVHLKRPIAISSFSPIGEKLEILGAVWGSFTGYKLIIISSLDLMAESERFSTYLVFPKTIHYNSSVVRRWYHN